MNFERVHVLQKSNLRQESNRGMRTEKSRSEIRKIRCKPLESKDLLTRSICLDRDSRS
jgi:hypothetical protein